MTGPLAPQFAQVRLAMSYPRPSYAHTGQYLGRHEAPKQVAADALAALSVIERHVQDMETALGRIADAVEAWDNDETPDEDFPFEADMDFVNFCGHLARAALPAREKEEETNG